MDNDGEVKAALIWFYNRVNEGFLNEQHKMKCVKVISCVFADDKSRYDMKAFLDKYEIVRNVPRVFGSEVENVNAWDGNYHHIQD
jgi:hypothetical protein